MAAAVGRADLFSLLALLGLLGTASAFLGSGFRLPTATFSSGSLVGRILETRSCVPDNFTSELPESLTTTVRTCVTSSITGSSGGRRRVGRSPQPFGGFGRRRGGHGGKHGGKKAQLLGCVARELNITGDNGVNQAALDTFLESLSSNTTFTGQLNASAVTCLDAVNSTLSAEQQSVFTLICIKLQQKADCARQNNNTSILSAKTLIKCPLGIPFLVSSTTRMTCKRQSFGSFTTFEEKARNEANCSLQAEDLASGDSVDLTAVGTAIDASTTTTDSEKVQQRQVLATCEEEGADTVDAFLDCWSNKSEDGCIFSKAEKLATGSKRRGGGRRGSRGGGRRGSRGGGRRRGGFFG